MPALDKNEFLEYCKTMKTEKYKICVKLIKKIHEELICNTFCIIFVLNLTPNT